MGDASRSDSAWSDDAILRLFGVDLVFGVFGAFGVLGVVGSFSPSLPTVGPLNDAIFVLMFLHALAADPLLVIPARLASFS